MRTYTLKYYHTVVRKPMLTFKKHILSQITKRQEQDDLLRDVEEEIRKKEYQYHEELIMEVEIQEDNP